MSLHPASVLRKSAQSIRHAPGLERLAPLWSRLRGPYRRWLARLTSDRGVPVTIGGHVIRLAPDVVSLNWETVEVEAYRTFADQIQPGAAVFDVGAHFGTYSIIAARVGGPSTRVIAYEPCDVTRRYLERHLQWNGADAQVTIRPVCCGRTSGEATFFITPDRPEGTNGLLPYERCVPTKVPVRTIDRDVERLGLVPSVIKIDVEGAELDVLAGAAGVLSTHRPRLLLSLHPQRLSQIGLTSAAVLNWLSARGYDCRMVSEDQEQHVLALPISQTP
jgi:FkbM family methyltransferase